MSMTRRTFCGAAACTLVSCGAGNPLATGGLDDPYPPQADLRAPIPPDLAGFSPDGGSCAAGSLDAGPASGFAVGSATRFTDQVTYDVWLCRDARGFYALNNECTHAACPVRPIPGPKFYCRCHGAEFDFNGDHPTAPALMPLDHLAVCLNANGNVIIDYNSFVAASERV